MEVKLIAMTDVMYENEPAGSVESAEYVCNHAAKTCTKEDAGDLVGQHYIVGEPCLIWEDNDLRPLGRALASGHESILEHAVYTFEVKGVSRVTEIQLVRHRIGVSYSIQSGRYCARDPTNYVVPFDPQDRVRDAIEGFNIALRNLDEELQFAGVKEEDRRYFYPQGLKTNIILTINARELRHIASLRMCMRAQKEIRELVTKMVKLAKEVSPTIFENVGASCEMTGKCPEGKKSCGRFKDGQN
ncbi:MAG: FAD-dependent thymidylate synthase [Candidatus Methanomethylophilaceae archaeon]|nr:FAD-dependent thymidylate synthase [Candidatus Methanomethylophilaceae archaeon]